MGTAGVDQFLFARRPLHQRRQHDRTCRKIDSGGQRFRTDADREQLVLEQLLHDPAVFRQDAGMMDADAPLQNLLQFRAGSFRPVVPGQMVHEPLLLSVRQQAFAFELLGDRPAFVAIETEDECRRAACRLVPVGHDFQLFAQELIPHPLVGQRNLPLGGLNQLDFSIEAPAQPDDEFGRVSDRGREQQHADVRRKHGEREFPDDAPFRIGEAVEFVHHDRADLAEIKRLGVQQPVQQDFGDDDEDPCVAVDAPVSRHQTDGLRGKTPTDRGLLHLAEFLFGERNQRRGVIGRLPV